MKVRMWTVFGASALVLGAVGLPLLARADGPLRTPGTVQSQRAWMRANGQTNGAGPGRWIWRQTENEPNLGPNGWPLLHGVEPSDPTKPETCVGCHTWIEGQTVSESGFTNILGETPGVTNLDVSPLRLLQSAIHVDPVTGAKTYDNKHAENFDKEGCFFCHKRHGAYNANGTLNNNFGCGKCHMADQGGPTSTPHLTHASLVNAEEPVADPADTLTGNPSCGFCHKQLLGQPVNPTVGPAACWNCHLSGHRPIQDGGVVYWKLPSAPQVPASER